MAFHAIPYVVSFTFVVGLMLMLSVLYSAHPKVQHEEHLFLRVCIERGDVARGVVASCHNRISPLLEMIGVYSKTCEQMLQLELERNNGTLCCDINGPRYSLCGNYSDKRRINALYMVSYSATHDDGKQLRATNLTLSATPYSEVMGFFVLAAFLAAIAIPMMLVVHQQSLFAQKTKTLLFMFGYVVLLCTQLCATTAGFYCLVHSLPAYTQDVSAMVAMTSVYRMAGDAFLVLVTFLYQVWLCGKIFKQPVAAGPKMKET